jgi:hypothetical protein
VFSFATSFEFCLSRKAAFTGISLRIAVALFFLVVFAIHFLPTALGKGRASSGIKEVFEEVFISANVLLEGPR